MNMKRWPMWLVRSWIWVRFGKVRNEIKDTINGIPCEIAFYGRKGRMIGYWAYGSFDPSFPYREQWV